MFKDLIIIPNFFNNPERVTLLARNQEYYSIDNHPIDKNTAIYWGGRRSSDLSLLDLNTFSDEFCETFNNKVIKETLDKQTTCSIKYNYNSFFHYFSSDYIGGQSELHEDSSIFSGVIYLNENPLQKPEDHGTIVFNKSGNHLVVPYEYNKLIMYRADYTHAPLSGFGSNVSDSRLSMCFFINQFEISIKRNTL